MSTADEVLAVLGERPEGATIAGMTLRVGRNRTTVRAVVARLVSLGIVERISSVNANGAFVWLYRLPVLSSGRRMTAAASQKKLQELNAAARQQHNASVAKTSVRIPRYTMRELQDELSQLRREIRQLRRSLDKQQRAGSSAG